MTAKEFLEKNCGTFEDSITKEVYADYVSPKILIEFAKYHVEKALKEALDSIPCIGSSSDIATYEEIEDAVLNAYPLTYII